MPAVADYLSAIQGISPTFKVSDGLSQEMQRRANEGASVDQVLTDAFKPGGYSELSQGAQDYVAPQYQAQNAALDTQLKGAQNNANYATTTANNTYDRLAKNLTQLYANNQQNDPLARQGIVSQQSNNYKTDQQAQNFNNIGQDLQSSLSNIANQLGTTSSGITNQRAALQTQQQQDVQNLVSQARANYGVAENTPFGTTAVSNGQTIQGLNKETGLTNLLSNPTIGRLATSPSFAPILQTMLGKYGVNLVDDVNGGQSAAPLTPTAPPVAPPDLKIPTNPPGNLPTADPTAALTSQLQSLFSDPTWKSSPGYTEKQLLPYLYSHYPQMSQSQINDLVYNTRKQYQ